MGYQWREDFKATFDSLVTSLSVILIAAFAASLFARVGWLFDLGSHFVIQYIIGACVLTPALFLLKKKQMAFLVLLVGLGSSIEVGLYHYRYYQPPLSERLSDQHLSVVQYNRLAVHMDHTDVIAWLRQNPFDVVVLQEATYTLSEQVKALKEEYPYQLHEPRHHAFGMIVLSRHKFNTAQKIDAGGTFAFKLSIEKHAGTPVTIYALHAMVPFNMMRDLELKSTAHHIANDNAERIIFMGDWNITPFSPQFDEILKISKLQHRDTGLYPVTTWPSFFTLPILQIPIDQVLFSPALKLVKKERGPAMGSDHYPLIATFAGFD